MHDHRAHPELPPGPNRSPLRNLYRWTSDMRGTLENARRGHGDVFTLRLFGARPMVCFATADAAREIMRESGAKLGMANDIVQAVLGPENVPLRNGAPHALHRRRLMPALTGEALFALAPTMKAVIGEGIDALPVGEHVRLVPWARRVTLGVIQQCLFGMREGPTYRAIADDILRLAEQGQRPLSLMASLLAPPELVLRMTRGRLAPDGSRLPDPPFLRPLLRQPLIRANRRVLDRLLAHVRGVREGRIAAPPTSMLASLLRLAEQQGAELTDLQLCDDLITLLIAGHDTTAISFSWLSLFLGRHPEVTEALRRELADAGGFESLGAERLGQLPYLDATIRESMRIAPIAVGVGRTTLAPVTIAGVDLPADVVVMAMTIGAQHAASTYPDPMRFDPSRMLERRLRPEHWFPFGGGYRRCIGAYFATMELKLLVAAFVECVAFEAIDVAGELGGGPKGIVTEPVNGAPFRIRAVHRSTRGRSCVVASLAPAA